MLRMHNKRKNTKEKKMTINGITIIIAIIVTWIIVTGWLTWEIWKEEQEDKKKGKKVR